LDDFQIDLETFHSYIRLQNSRIFCERGRPSICKRKAVWSECENGEGEWGGTPYGRARLARFTSEDRAYGASRLPKTSENDCFAVYSYMGVRESLLDVKRN